MAYYPHKHYKRKDGTYRWRVVYETVKDGKRIQRIVPKKEWAEIGFSETMTLEDAQAFAKSINTEVSLKRHEDRRQEISTKLAKEDKEKSVWLPEIFVKGFERDWLLKQDTKANIKSHWRAAKRIIKSIKLHPHEWSETPDVLFQEFVRLKISLSYAEKLLRVLNEWGIYISRKTKKAFIPVKPPKGKKRERIADAYFDSGKRKKKSEPITPEELTKARHELQISHYNWLFISIWFGLRPIEVDNLKNTDMWEVREDEKVQVLWVYQPKLVAVPRDERWKLIPLLFPEQFVALEILKTKNYRRPMVDTVNEKVKRGATPYGGRKGFHSLMKSRGQRFEDISAWLGHRSLDRTWLDYTERLKVSLKRNSS